jgi:ARG/rhodanese/phosphatase superfamily protein
MPEQTPPHLDPAPRSTFPFQLGEPVEHRGIVVAPLFPGCDPVARYTTLDDALARGFEITETGPEGAVPELAVSNPLDEAVLLYDGEELAGAKQNRILNVSVLVAPGSKLVVPVSCVEQGRWRAVSRSFSSAGNVAHAQLRRLKARALRTEPLARGAAQGAVWDSVDARLQALDVDSATRAHSDAFRAHRRRLDDLAAAFSAAPGQCGAVLGIGNTLCVDALSRPDAFAALWPKLRDGYLLDALDRLDRRPTRPERLFGFVDEVAGSELTSGPASGLGADLRLRGPGVVGSGLELDGELIQLSAFTITAEAADGRIARPSLRAG